MTSTPTHTPALVRHRKSELSRLCLQLPPPTCPKRVWFLDLGHPMFGMSPLRLTGSDPLPLQATAIADNIVAALLDINENQIFQSSRRYLYHAVIGALALAAKQRRRARFEDVYQLLLPAKSDARTAVYQACADTPDLDQTAEFFRTELPQDLQIAGSATAQRLDAPRNKVSGLPGVALLADEAHYIASAENVVDQIATHRAAGLDVTFGLQYLAQLGAGTEHEQKIRKGIANLLQSRMLFRL